MKKISNYIILISVLIGVAFSSCKNFLELKPEGVILEEDALKNKDSLLKLLNSSYDAARSGNYFGGRVWYLPDMMADDLDGTLFTTDWGSFYNHRTSIFIPACGEVWQDPYIVTYRVNTILAKLEEVEGLTEQDKKWFEGQCKFWRAVGHFELVRIFGQPYGSGRENEAQSGIPIRLIASQDKTVRNTTQEVYTQVLKDLDESIAALTGNFNVPKWYVNVWAAKAYKARVLFQMNRTTDCLPILNEVIQYQGDNLEMDLEKRISTWGGANEPFGKEVIFGLHSRSDINTDLLDRYKKRSNGTVDLPISNEILSLVNSEPNDLRATAWIETSTVDGRTIVVSKKFNYLNNSRKFIIPIIHLTDLKLMRAECLASSNGLGALADLNAIRNRAGLLDFTSTDVNALKNEIRKQRRIEMFGEGSRLHEVKKVGAFEQSGLTIRLLDPVLWNCPGMIAQIPNAEIAGNLNILRNEEGGCN